MKNKVLLDICLALIILLFTYTSVSKFLDHERFVFHMRQAPVPMMRQAAPFIGWIIPWIEAALVSGLVFSRYRLYALYVSLGLLILFEGYISIMMLSGLSLPCTCGGVIAKLSWGQHLIFNLVFIMVNIIAINLIRKKTTLTGNTETDSKELSRA